MVTRQQQNYPATLDRPRITRRRWVGSVVLNVVAAQHIYKYITNSPYIDALVYLHCIDISTR